MQLKKSRIGRESCPKITPPTRKWLDKSHFYRGWLWSIEPYIIIFSTAKNLLGWPLRCTFQYIYPWYPDIPILCGASTLSFWQLIDVILYEMSPAVPDSMFYHWWLQLSSYITTNLRRKRFTEHGTAAHKASWVSLTFWKTENEENQCSESPKNQWFLWF